MKISRTSSSYPYLRVGATSSSTSLIEKTTVNQRFYNAGQRPGGGIVKWYARKLRQISVAMLCSQFLSILRASIAMDLKEIEAFLFKIH